MTPYVSDSYSRDSSASRCARGRRGAKDARSKESPSQIDKAMSIQQQSQQRGEGAAVSSTTVGHGVRGFISTVSMVPALFYLLQLARSSSLSNSLHTHEKSKVLQDKNQVVDTMWWGDLACVHYRPSKLLYSCSGSRCKLCSTYEHTILPNGAQGRNFNSCCHVRRIGLWNATLSEEMYTTQGLKVRFNEKGMARLRKAYNGKALKLVFKDKTKWCDVACKVAWCPCTCYVLTCCKELQQYDLLIPGEAFVEGTDVPATFGIKGSSCCFATGLCWCAFLACSSKCENQVRVHHTEYELVDHLGDFIAPRPMDMERSVAKRPASPTNRSAAGAGGFAAPGQYVEATSPTGHTQEKP